MYFFFRFLMLLLFSGAASAAGISPMGGLDGIGLLFLVTQYFVLPLVVLFFLIKYLIPEFSRNKDTGQSGAVDGSSKGRAILSWLFAISALVVFEVGSFFFYSETVFSLVFFCSLIIYGVSFYYFLLTLVSFFNKERKGLYVHFSIALLIHVYLLYLYFSLAILMLTQV